MQLQHRKCTIEDGCLCRGNSAGNHLIGRIYHRQRFASPVGKWILKMLQRHNQVPNLENRTATPRKMTKKIIKIDHTIFWSGELCNKFYEPDRLMNWKLNQVDTTVWNHVHRHNSKSLHNWPNHLICSIRIDGDILRLAANQQKLRGFSIPCVVNRLKLCSSMNHWLQFEYKIYVSIFSDSRHCCCVAKAGSR